MIIDKIEIAKFRGFQGVEVNFGTHLTVIAGQNGTQKTTLLGLLSQPFTITDKENPMISEKPLCGGNYKSAFKEKFRLSEKFDTAKSHEWTLTSPLLEEPFTLESMPRGGGSDDIRFWRKGDREKGSGYIQLPVIYLSLKRLLPIGEDKSLNESESIQLTDDEIQFYKKWHNKILLIQQKIKDTNFLSSKNKDTLGVNTEYYDWKQNSAGQDNIGKILLAFLSFRRLQKNFKEHYQGGLLVIDEIDATLYPASQIELIDALRKFASNFNIQIVLSTHSLNILKNVYEKQIIPEIEGQNRIVFLEKVDNKVVINPNITYNSIKHKLNVTMAGPEASKIDVFVEDKETAAFAKALLKGKSKKLKFIDCSFSCTTLIDLPSRKVPSFVFPHSLIILDGDVRTERKSINKIKKHKNFVILPTNFSPEKILAKYLYELEDGSDVWLSVNEHFTKQLCFRKYTYEEVMEDREKAKLWFNLHLKSWGTNATKIINPWMKDNPTEVSNFISDFNKVYNLFAEELSLEKI